MRERIERQRLGDAITLEAAGPGAWRICDIRLAPDEGRFLAFVEEKADGFEVMELAEGFEWTTFSNMVAALEHVVERRSALLSSRSTGELLW